MASGRRPNWRTWALCAIRGIDPELYYQADNNAALAKRLRVTCRVCPVRVPCLRENIRVPYGMWGGLTWKQRRRITGQTAEDRGFFDTRLPTYDHYMRRNGMEVKT